MENEPKFKVGDTVCVRPEHRGYAELHNLPISFTVRNVHSALDSMEGVGLVSTWIVDGFFERRLEFATGPW